MWQLHVAKGDSKWPFVQDYINLIEASLQAGACDKACLTLYGSGRAPAAILFQPSSTRTAWMVSSLHSTAAQTKSTEMTKDQFWHHLTGLPELRDVHLILTSDQGASHAGLKALAKQMFGVGKTRKRKHHAN